MGAKPSKNRYDAIVVGAGPSGIAAALTIARGGMEPLLIERGVRPGAKNLFGGQLYRHVCEEAVPGFVTEAPLERPVVRIAKLFITGNSYVGIDFASLRYRSEPDRYVAMRNRFDPWFASKAVDAGAELLTGTTVRDLLKENDGKGKEKERVVGVKTDDGTEILADAVILAEGVYPKLGIKAGLVEAPLSPHNFGLYAKETLSLPAEFIEERFGLHPGEGAIISYSGATTYDLVGSAAIFTLREGLSVVVGAYLDQMVAAGVGVDEMMTRFKTHPLIEPYLKGAVTQEFSAHLIPMGGYNAVPKLYGDGVMICGDAAQLVNAKEGTNLALKSGLLAGETYLNARKRGDFSAQGLGDYGDKLAATFVLKDLRANAGVAGFYRRHPEVDEYWISLINDLMYTVITVGPELTVDKRRKVRQMLLRGQPISKSMRQGFDAFRANYF